jgi:hypothetical protein
MPKWCGRVVYKYHTIQTTKYTAFKRADPDQFRNSLGLNSQNTEMQAANISAL